MKVFYYPAFFRLRRLGDTKALVLATVFTFFATWLLHIVQWFWIRGSFLLEWNDMIFWAIFCALVIVNSLYEARPGRTRDALSRSHAARERRPGLSDNRHIRRRSVCCGRSGPPNRSPTGC